MRFLILRWVMLLSLLVAVSCQDDTEGSGADGGAVDRGAADGARVEASVPDAMRPDAMRPDTMRPDAMRPDTANASCVPVYPLVVDTHNATDTSMFVDPGGKVHISTGFNSLRYVTNKSGKWAAVTIDASTSVGNMNSLVVLPSNKVHVSHCNSMTRSLLYTNNDTGPWKTTTIDPGAGLFDSLALDAQAKSHISYYDYGGKRLKYATNAQGSWKLQVVDAKGDVGHYSSIALDSKGKVHVAYGEETRNPPSYSFGLKYATNRSGKWVVTKVESSYINYISLVLDAADKAHISYYKTNTPDALKYATNASGTWVTEMVDAQGGGGRYNSLGLDSKGNAHISYLSDTYKALKYATNQSGAWKTVIADTGGGAYTSLVVDPTDKVHFVYRGAAYKLTYRAICLQP